MARGLGAILGPAAGDNAGREIGAAPRWSPQTNTLLESYGEGCRPNHDHCILSAENRSAEDVAKRRIAASEPLTGVMVHSYNYRYITRSIPRVNVATRRRTRRGGNVFRFAPPIVRGATWGYHQGI